jgi:hypothetical protein
MGMVGCDNQMEIWMVSIDIVVDHNGHDEHYD